MDKCPLCNCPPTEFAHPLSDSGNRLPFIQQRCRNRSCELPCRLWEPIATLTARVAELEENNKWPPSRRLAICIDFAAKVEELEEENQRLTKLATTTRQSADRVALLAINRGEEIDRLTDELTNHREAARAGTKGITKFPESRAEFEAGQSGNSTVALTLKAKQEAESARARKESR